MLKFIVIEDNDNYLHKVRQNINKLMMNNNCEYKIYNFNDYTTEVKKIMKQEGPKIYVIDIELPTKSGIDIAREIREDDYYSQIIIASAHNELSYLVFKSKLMILDFISKYDNYDNKMLDTLYEAINILEKGNVLKLENKLCSLIINCSDILYISKDPIEKKCTIKTKNSEYVVNYYLCELQKKLNKNFVKAHRSYIINFSQVEEIGYKDMAIKFKNGIIIKNIVSKTYKKGLLKNWN